MTQEIFNDASAAQDVYVWVRGSEATVGVYSNGVNTIPIKHFDGNDYDRTYLSGGSAVQVDSSNSQAFIRGPGKFKIEKPINTPLHIALPTDANVKVSLEAL